MARPTGSHSVTPPSTEIEIESLRRERDRFRALVDLTAEGFSIFNDQAVILYESPANTRIHGYSQKEMEGKNLFDFTHPEDVAHAGPIFARLVAQPGGIASDTIRFRHKDGHWIYLEGTVVNRLDDPRIKGLINNFRDVTARVETERELKRAKEAAEQAQRLQQHFLTNLSHEFRTPLTLIQQPMKDLRAACSDLNDHPLWNIVEGNLHRLNDLFSELIDLSLLEAGAFSLRTRLGDASAFFNAQIAYFAPTAAARGITLCPAIGKTPPLYFDAAKLAKVVSNLLTNALKFTPAGGRVTCALHAETAANDPLAGRVHFSVSDTGPGISPQETARIFDRFYQVAQGDTRPAEGMGVGLALAREMVELHGGEIGVESQPGRGSKFWFWLPLGTAHLLPEDIDLNEATPSPHAEVVSLPTEIPTAPSDDEADLDKPALLLVEDNPDLRYYLGLHLREHYRVINAADGVEALACLAKERPALVLSDVMMPRLDGLELCRRLRADPATAGLPFVLLSAKGSHEDRTAGLAAGASDYVCKPFAMPELVLRLKRFTPLAPPPGEPAVIARWKTSFLEAIRRDLGSPDFNIQTLSKALGMSERQLQRRCQEVFDCRPGEIVRQERLLRAQELLRAGEYATVAETAYAVGMTPSYLTRLFRSQLGTSPKTIKHS